MLVSGALVMTFLTGVGGVMTNYAWREAQWEELRSALRAAVSASGPALGGAGGAGKAAIEERVGDFVEGLLPQLDLDSVTVQHDVATDVTTVTVAGEYVFTFLWGGGPEDREPIRESVDVKLEVDRFEVAVAVDLSSSMLKSMPSGTPGVSIVKLDGLKQAMETVLDVVERASANDPGSIMVSVVPFGVAVNVADTCNPDPDTGACRADYSEDKERYVRMLAGPQSSRSALLRAARDRGDHWVDTFHHYGAGSGLGPLSSQRLPEDLLNSQDWNLRRTDVKIDVSAQAPNLDTGEGAGLWVVDDEDFWNGCLMARWGRYWDTDARPAGWIADDTSNWPVTKEVPGWSPADQVLPADTPLHLSDAPPESRDPSTLFTAYSWPDARIGMAADHRLQSVMHELLKEDLRNLTTASQGDNDWSVSEDRGGASLCPPSPLSPLTEDVEALNVTIGGLDTVPRHGWANAGISANYLHLGIVWGLRAISPLWRNTWAVKDSGGRDRPATSCAPGDAGISCETDLHKSIIIVSDGANDFGPVSHRQHPPTAGRNPNFDWRALGNCESLAPSYFAAASERTAAAFNAHFADYVAADGTFDSGKVEPVLDAFHAHGDSLPDTAARRLQRSAALATVTPWQIFRGVDDEGAIERLLDDANEFGFTGRPVQIHHFCGRSSIFGAYGRVNEAIRVGSSSTLPSTLLEPVDGAAPFEIDFDHSAESDIPYGFRDQLDDWLYEACKLAGQRRVRVNGIFMGQGSGTGREVMLLKECVLHAGGDPDADVWVTPTAEGLESAFREIFTIRRNLRFLN